MKDRNIFKKLTGLESGSGRWQVATSKTAESEKWLYHLLPADAEAPNIEDEKAQSPFVMVAAISIVLIAILLIKLFTLQVITGNENLSVAESNRVKEKVVRAPRGLIYDRSGIQLVKNIPSYDLVVIPVNLPPEQTSRDEVFNKLAEITKVSIEEIKEKIIAGGIASSQPVLIIKNISKDDAILIESRIKELVGVRLEVNPIREYSDNGLLSHTLGYVGRISQEEWQKNPEYLMNDYLGKSGVEKYYEETLRGINGAERYEVDSTGKNEKILGQTDPVPGKNIKLSIDLDLQRAVTEALQKQMQGAKVTKASGVVINPKNGEVLALVSLPGYDNNLFAKGIGEKDYQNLIKNPDNPLVFRPLSGEYPSGSSIKPFIAFGALEEGYINEGTYVTSTGGIRIGEFFFPDWKPGGHGRTNVVKAIAESVNTFFYAIGGGHQNIKGLGPEKIKSYLEKFNFSNYLGIDLDGEARGSIPDPAWKQRVKAESWYLGDTYNMSIGQGDVLITPLQLANATATIANGGTLFQPRVVSSYLNDQGADEKVLTSQIVNSPIGRASSINIVKKGMRETVTSGSGRLLNSLPVAVAGKTGTAQFGPNNSKEHAWFTSFAPFDDPQIVVTVLIEGAGGGDKYAAPAAYDIFKYFYSR